MRKLFWIMAIVLIVFTSCGADEEPVIEEEPIVVPVVVPVSTPIPTPQPTPEPEPEPEPDPIFPNEIGEIMIIMYHGLVYENASPYDRTIEGFRSDLQWLYDEGYRLISMYDLINNNITTPAGFTPVVISFDDGRSSAFSFVEDEDGNLTPAPDSAVYIMNAFYEENPDFGRTAIFFVNYHPEPFRGAGTFEERFRYLIDHGFEIGNHGLMHQNFALLNARSLQREIGQMDQFIRGIIPDYNSLVLAYPFGIRPWPDLRHYVMEGEYYYAPYSHAWALRVGNTGVPANPHHINFDPTNVSRVVGTDLSTPYRRVPDFGYMMRFYERNPHLRFISDGDPNTLTVPECQLHLVNMYSLGDMELITYVWEVEEEYCPEDECECPDDYTEHEYSDEYENYHSYYNGYYYNNYNPDSTVVEEENALEEEP